MRLIAFSILRLLLTDKDFYLLVYHSAKYIVKKRKAKKDGVIDKQENIEIEIEKKDVLEAFQNTLNIIKWKN